ncbi:hypothetical protein HZC07_02205 [Candidatus Micrarchaeota archaeon]|nr:hypothetical protein [Candidatus Micrarchaeota archaeon]
MDIGSDLLLNGLKNGKIEKIKYDIHEQLVYFRFKEHFRGIARGTVILSNRIIPGFPHIKRIFTLCNGLKKNLTCEKIYAEEKIDGFNVRVVSINNQI